MPCLVLNAGTPETHTDYAESFDRQKQKMLAQEKGQLKGNYTV